MNPEPDVPGNILPEKSLPLLNRPEAFFCQVRIIGEPGGKAGSRGSAGDGKFPFSGQCADLCLGKACFCEGALYAQLGEGPQSRAKDGQVIGVCAVGDRGDLQLLCQVQEFLKKHFFAEIAAVLRIISDGGVIHLIDGEDPVAGVKFPADALCRSHVGGRVQKGLKGDGKHSGAVFVGGLLHEQKKEGAVHSAGEGQNGIIPA